MPNKKMGGARPGAGRKPTGRIRKTIWVTPSEFEKIRSLLNEWRKQDADKCK
jgi:hypothetical protein